MGSDLLKDELQKLQLEYKNILKDASENIFQRDSNALIDEINIFWYRNKKLVTSILHYLHEPYNAYVFTAATILDIEDYEHYPFVSLGNVHIWDDPICMYTKISGKAKNNAFGEKMRQQIIATINDNIRILEQAEDIIYILPIRLLSNIDADMIRRASQQAFFSLFKTNMTFEFYKKNFKTISDIKKELLPNIEKSIIFNENDDNTLDFETRFRNYKESMVLFFKSNSTDAEIFWFCIYSWLSQVFEIILMCAEYQMIPYIRFEVTFKYMLMLSANFADSDELKNMAFKCAIAYMLHHSFDKERLHKIDFKEYYQIIQNYSFENNLFSDLKQESISLFNPSLGKVKCIIKKNFESMLAKSYIKK